MRSVRTSLFRDFVGGCRWLAGRCGLGDSPVAVVSMRTRTAGRSFVTAMAGLAIVLSSRGVDIAICRVSRGSGCRTCCRCCRRCRGDGYRLQAESHVDGEQMVEKLWTGADTVWVLICSMLVFFMNLGFGCVETGFARSKNCVNILSKNFIVFAATSVAFWLIGWDLMFGAGDGGWIGQSGHLDGGWLRSEVRQQPVDGRQVSGRVRLDQLDARAALREVFLPARLRGNRRDDRVGSRRRADQVPRLHHLLVHHGDRDLSGRRPLGSGASATSRRNGTSGTSPAARWCIRWVAGRPSPVRSSLGLASASTAPTARSTPSRATT